MESEERSETRDSGYPGQVIPSEEAPIRSNAHQSQSIAKLAAALAKAQLAFKPIVKSVENSFYSTEKKKAMYADLAAIIAATQKPLAENGLVIIQTPLIDAETFRAGISSLLAHSSGEWLKNEILLPATEKRKEYAKDGTFTWKEQFTAQTCGIAITYARRYDYQSIVGIAAEQDDDANSISVPAGSAQDAALAADRRIAEMKAKMAEHKPNGPVAAANLSIDSPSVLYGMLKSAKRLHRKPPAKGDYLALEVINAKDQLVKLSAFDNRKYPGDQSLFNMLAMAAEGKGQVIRLKVKSVGNYLNLDEPEAIGPIVFHDGLPVIEREAGDEPPPPDDSDLYV